MRHGLIIFDLDGTLYRFPGSGSDRGIFRTGFYREVRENAAGFVSEVLGTDRGYAKGIIESISKRYDGDISIGLEKEFGIDRFDYFRGAWDIDAGKYIEPDPDLREALSMIPCRKAVLTSAPLVWAENALERLGIKDAFSGVWSGEYDIRKPDKMAYMQVYGYFGVSPKEVMIVEDEPMFLLPAKELGMTTVLVGGEKRVFIDYNIDSVCDVLKIGGVLDAAPPWD